MGHCGHLHLIFWERVSHWTWNSVSGWTSGQEVRGLCFPSSSCPEVELPSAPWNQFAVTIIDFSLLWVTVWRVAGRCSSPPFLFLLIMSVSVYCVESRNLHLVSAAETSPASRRGGIWMGEGRADNGICHSNLPTLIGVPR